MIIPFAAQQYSGGGTGNRLATTPSSAVPAPNEGESPTEERVTMENCPPPTKIAEAEDVGPQAEKKDLDDEGKPESESDDDNANKLPAIPPSKGQRRQRNEESKRRRKPQYPASDVNISAGIQQRNQKGASTNSRPPEDAYYPERDEEVLNEQIEEEGGDTAGRPEPVGLRERGRRGTFCETRRRGREEGEQVLREGRSGERGQDAGVCDAAGVGEPVLGVQVR